MFLFASFRIKCSFLTIPGEKQIASISDSNPRVAILISNLTSSVATSAQYKMHQCLSLTFPIYSRSNNESEKCSRNAGLEIVNQTFITSVSKNRWNFLVGEEGTHASTIVIVSVVVKT